MITVFLPPFVPNKIESKTPDSLCSVRMIDYKTESQAISLLCSCLRLSLTAWAAENSAHNASANISILCCWCHSASGRSVLFIFWFAFYGEETESYQSLKRTDGEDTDLISSEKHLNLFSAKLGVGLVLQLLFSSVSYLLLFLLQEEGDGDNQTTSKLHTCPHCNRSFKGLNYFRFHVKGHLGESVTIDVDSQH